MKEQYAKQKYPLYFTSDAETQFKNLKDHNWNSPKQDVRDLFNNVVFPRIDNTLFGIVNEDDFDDYENGRNNDKIADFPDNIGSVLFQVKKLNNQTIIEIQRFIWTFKQNKWLKDVLESSIKKTSTKILYESIMQDVSNIIKMHLKRL